MQSNIKNRDHAVMSDRQKSAPPMAKQTPTPAPQIEATRTDTSDRGPVHIGPRVMPCCGRGVVPHVERWLPNGDAAIQCPSCGKRSVFTPPMIRLK